MRRLVALPDALLKTRLAISFICALAVSLSAQVTPDRLLHADREPQNWLTYTAAGRQYIAVAADTALYVFGLP